MVYNALDYWALSNIIKNTAFRKLISLRKVVFITLLYDGRTKNTKQPVEF